MINLIGNAVSAFWGRLVSAEAPRLIVKSIYLRPEAAIFEVADNGSGILCSDKARIFDPYFTRKEKVAGLGFAIVTSIISDHHGQIRLY